MAQLFDTIRQLVAEAVWSYLHQSGVAKLVTVHFFDRD
jgi:hypothetical protein